MESPPIEKKLNILVKKLNIAAAAAAANFGFPFFTEN